MKERQVQIKTESENIPSDEKLKRLFNNFYNNIKDIEINHDTIEGGRIKIIDVYIKQETVEKELDKDYYDEHILLRRETNIKSPFSVNGWENNI